MDSCTKRELEILKGIIQGMINGKYEKNLLLLLQIVNGILREGEDGTSGIPELKTMPVDSMWSGYYD